VEYCRHFFTLCVLRENNITTTKRCELFCSVESQCFRSVAKVTKL